MVWLSSAWGWRSCWSSINAPMSVFAMLYAHFGPWMPELIIHKGYSIERITTTLWLTTEGIFGLPIGVAATFVFASPFSRARASR